MKKLIILSGGQDSTTCLVLACLQLGAANVGAITFNYGQRHSRELQASKDVAKLLGVTDHEIVDLGPILKGTSPLTNPAEKLEQYSDFKSMDATIGDRVEKTFVPMRNALFLTIAANRAVVGGYDTIVTGVCQADNANYPDCREQFIFAQEDAINEALGYTRAGVSGWIEIETPLMNLTKAQSIRMLHNHGRLWLLAFTHTAYDGQYPPVGKDHANVLRAEGFREAGFPDPLIVRAVMEGLMDWPEGDNYRGVWGADSERTADLGGQIRAAQAQLGHIGERAL
jgi:7-cyano-7-deazaguanine synthase